MSASDLAAIALGLPAEMYVINENWPEPSSERDWRPLLQAVALLGSAALLYVAGHPVWALIALAVALAVGE